MHTINIRREKQIISRVFFLNQVITASWNWYNIANHKIIKKGDDGELWKYSQHSDSQKYDCVYDFLYVSMFLSWNIWNSALLMLSNKQYTRRCWDIKCLEYILITFSRVFMIHNFHSCYMFKLDINNILTSALTSRLWVSFCSHK
jgi:hypothetical protein